MKEKDGKKEMGKEKEREAEETEQPETKCVGIQEMDDVLPEIETALGNLEIITQTMKQHARDGFGGVEDDAVRHAYYKLADLAEEALQSLGCAHDVLNTAYKAA